MLKELAKLKNSTKPVDDFEDAYKIVENKLKLGKQIKADELRKWFIKSYEKKYNTVMLGTNIHYCYKTFNKVKDKYTLCNNELARRIITWSERYHKLGYDFDGKAKFDFSVLNTDWLLDNLENNIPNVTTKQVTFQNDNVNQIDTKNRRI